MRLKRSPYQIKKPVQFGLVLLELLMATAVLGFLLAGLARVQQQYSEQRLRAIDAERFAGYVSTMTKFLMTPVIYNGSTGFENPSLKGLTEATDRNNLEIITEGIDSYGQYFKFLEDHTIDFFNASLLATSCVSGQRPDKAQPAEVFLGCVGKDDFTFAQQELTLNMIRVQFNREPFFSSTDVSLSKEVKHLKPTELVIVFDGLREDNWQFYSRWVATMQQRLIGSLKGYDVKAFIGVSNDSYYPESLLKNLPFSAQSIRENYGTIFNPPLVMLDHKVKRGVVFQISFPAPAPLSSDGSIALARNKPLCWTFSDSKKLNGTLEGELKPELERQRSEICLQGVGSESRVGPKGGEVHGLAVEGGVTFEGKDFHSGQSVEKTPAEISFHSFEPDQGYDSSREPGDYNPASTGGKSVLVPQIVCPFAADPNDSKGIKNLWVNKVAVATSSFSNSGAGRFELSKGGDYREGIISTHNHLADLFTGLLYGWTNVEKSGEKFWEIEAVAGAPEPSLDDNMHEGKQVKNPPSVSFMVYQWCEKE